MNKERVEVLSDGNTVTHYCEERIVLLAMDFLRGMFADGEPRKTADMVDEVVGAPSNVAVLEDICYGTGSGNCHWDDSPFFPALARLVDAGEIWCGIGGTEDKRIVWYSEPERLPAGVERYEG